MNDNDDEDGKGYRDVMVTVQMEQNIPCGSDEKSSRKSQNDW